MTNPGISRIILEAHIYTEIVITGARCFTWPELFSFNTRGMFCLLPCYEYDYETVMAPANESSAPQNVSINDFNYSAHDSVLAAKCFEISRLKIVVVWDLLIILLLFR